MKPTLLSIILCFTAFTTFAEVTLRGIITYQNTGEKMKTLQVTARGASPTLVKASTNTEGVFVLTFPNGKVGDLVTVELGTPIYDVVNDARELSVVLTDNPTYKIRLVVCKKGERDANAVSYYNISTKYLETNYQKQVQKKDAAIEKLEKQLKEKGANEMELTKQLYALKDERAKLDEALEAQKKNAYKMAEDFSRIDLAEADAIYRKAFETFKNGDIDGARAVLNGADAKKQETDLVQRSADIEKSKENIRKVKENLKKAEQNIAQAEIERDSLKAAIVKKKMLDGKLAELQNKYDEAEQLYTEGVNLDTMDLNNLEVLSEFLFKQKNFKKSIDYTQRGIRLSKTDRQIEYYYNMLASNYQSTRKIADAEIYFLKSLEICERLLHTNPPYYKPRIATNILNLGNLKIFGGLYDESEKYLLKALETFESLARDNAEKYEGSVATTELVLGNLYAANKRFEDSEKHRLKAIELYERLAKNNAIEPVSRLAQSYMNLANLYFNYKVKVEETEKLYAKSLEINERLVKINPQRIEPNIALVLSNFGSFYKENMQLDKAQTLLKRALTIRQKALLNGQMNYFSPYFEVFNNLVSVKCSFVLSKDTIQAKDIQMNLLKSMEILRGGLTLSNIKDPIALNDLSGAQILVNLYADAEQSAKRGLEVDSTKVFIKANLGHALLFQNKDVEARSIYDDLKIKKNAKGISYRDILKEDFDALEQAGLDKTQLDKARKWVAE